MRRLPIVASLLFTALLAVTGTAQRSLPLTLEGMVRQAGIIVHARVVSTESGRDPRTGMPATWTTLEVNENFFGATATTVRYKQFGGEVDEIVTPTPDIPRLKAGEELILMLYPPSKQTGFQSPVGMAQGVFRIGKQGSKKRVTQSVHSPQLFKTSARPGAAAVRDGPMDFDDFARILRSVVREVKP